MSWACKEASSFQQKSAAMRQHIPGVTFERRYGQEDNTQRQECTNADLRICLTEHGGAGVTRTGVS